MGVINAAWVFPRLLARFLSDFGSGRRGTLQVTWISPVEILATCTRVRDRIRGPPLTLSVPHGIVLLIGPHNTNSTAYAQSCNREKTQLKMLFIRAYGA